MFMHNRDNVMRGPEEEDEVRGETSHQLAVEISEENTVHVAENKILQEHNKMDELFRIDCQKKNLDRKIVEEKIVESEKFNKQTEYRQFLLKQIEDKEKCKKKRNSPDIRGNSYTYSEEFMTAEGKQNLKLTKQQEMRDALDECIRQKNALKLKNKEKEVEEEKTRANFMEKQEAEGLEVREKAKHLIEIKEHRKEEATKHWNTNKEEERNQFINSLMNKNTTFSQVNRDFAEMELEDRQSQDGESTISEGSEVEVREIEQGLEEEQKDIKETKENETYEVGQQDYQL